MNITRPSKNSIKSNKTKYIILPIFAVAGLIAGLSVFAANSFIAIEPSGTDNTVSDNTASGSNYYEFKEAATTPTPTPTPTPSGSNSLATIISDTWAAGDDAIEGFAPWAKNDAYPALNTSYYGYEGASDGLWTDLGEFTSMTSACSVYAQEDGIGETNFVLQIRKANYRELIDGDWKVLYEQTDTKWSGQAIEKDSLVSVNAEVNVDEDGVQIISWPDGEDATGLYIYDERFDTQKGDARFLSVQMRIAYADNSDVDLSKVRLLGNCSMQHIAVRDGCNGPSCSYSESYNPRYKWITSEWQYFNMITTPSERPGTKPSFTYEEAAQAITDINPPL